MGEHNNRKGTEMPTMALIMVLFFVLAGGGVAIIHAGAKMDAKINHLLENRLIALELSKALEDLLDEQNGPPLERDKERWQRAYDAAQIALDDAIKKLGVTRKSQGRD